MNWKIITEFPNYEINELGQIRRISSGKILSQSLNTKGYYQVNIKNKSRRTHRLLAIAFISNPKNLETVNHIDGNKLNNTLTNLEWMSRADNVKHSREVLGKTPIPYSKSNKIHHLIGKTGINSCAGKQIMVELLDGTIKTYGSSAEAAFDLFGDRNLGKQIRQSIKRGSVYYRNLKFKENEIDKT